MPLVNTQPIALTLADGSLALMQFVLSEYHEHTPTPSASYACTPELIEARIAKAAISEPSLAGATWRLLLPMEIPQDKTFRAAWRDVGTTIEHDMPHVRQIHLDRLRRLRTPLLEQLDRDFTQAQGTLAVVTATEKLTDPLEKIARDNLIAAKTDVVVTIEAERQVLRDLPTTIAAALEAALTIDDVKAIQPI